MFSTELYHRFAPADPARAAVLGELWGQVIIVVLFDPLILNYCTAQSKIPWGHCWFGDDAAKADPRGGFDTEEEFLDHVKSFDILPVILFILHPG